MTDAAPFLLEHMTWEEVRDAAAADVPAVLSIGSIEQHGPHLPLATDSLLPAAVVAKAAERTRLVHAPVVRFGARSRALSGGGETFPGTLSLRATTLMATITEVLCGLARGGFRRLCVHNFHSENAGFLWEACDLAAAEHPDVRILLLESPLPQFTPQELDEIFPDGFLGWDIEHASAIETSMMLVLYPELVRTERIVDDRSTRRPDWDVVPAPPEFLTASGVLWKATEANLALGRRFVEAAVRRLVEALEVEFGRPA